MLFIRCPRAQIIYYVKYMLKFILVSKNFLTWLLIGWQLCCQPIRCQVWKSLLTNMDFNKEMSQKSRPQMLKASISHLFLSASDIHIVHLLLQSPLTECAWTDYLNITKYFKAQTFVATMQWGLSFAQVTLNCGHVQHHYHTNLIR